MNVWGRAGRQACESKLKTASKRWNLWQESRSEPGLGGGPEPVRCGRAQKDGYTEESRRPCTKKHRRQVCPSSGEVRLRRTVRAAEQRRAVGLCQGCKLCRCARLGKVRHGRRQQGGAQAAVARAGTLGVRIGRCRTVRKRCPGNAIGLGIGVRHSRRTMGMNQTVVELVVLMLVLPLSLLVLQEMVVPLLRIIPDVLLVVNLDVGLIEMRVSP